MHLAKFIVAVILIIAAMALFIGSGAMLIGGQWAAIFGAVNAGQIKTGLVWVAAGFVAGGICQLLAIKLLVSEPEWQPWWMWAAMTLAVGIAHYFGLTLLALVVAPILAFHTRRQVKQARAKAAASVSAGDPKQVSALWS